MSSQSWTGLGQEQAVRSGQEAGSAMPSTSTGSEVLAGAPPPGARTPQLCQEAHPAGAA